MKRKMLLILFIAISSSFSQSFAQTYVDASATGNNDGSSWTDAYSDLQQAIYDAQSGDVIWVGQGTYIPSIDEAGSLPASLRLRHFWLKDGVQVFGGFNGTELEFNQRNVNTQKAILDGQVDASNKAYHVISTDASSTAKLDGFIVRNGDAGIGSSEGVSNSGGGLYLTGDAQFFNIEFENNIGYHHGGAVFAAGSSSLFVNCRFEGNTTTLYDGAAIYAQTSSNLQFFNCVLYNNTANRFGGAAAVAGSSTVLFQNASIANNTGVNVYQASTVSTINHNQSTLWGNTNTIGIDSGGGSSVNFSECIYQWAAAGTNVNSDPLYTNIATGDLTLSAASPAIDAVTLAPYNPYRDIVGNYRIAGSALDMGAYEYNSVQGQIIYVDKDAVGANNGSSWADAFPTLQDALVNITFTQDEEIWIADGTYTPHASDRSAYWSLPNEMKIYGGFNATETLRSQRDAALNPVILSGDLNNDDNSNIDYAETTRSENSYHLLLISGPRSGILIDGVTLSDANANGTGNALTAPVLITFHTGADHLIQISFNDVIVENNTAINAAIYQNFHFATQGGTTVVNFSHSVIRDNASTSVLGNMQYIGDRGYNQKNYGKIDNCLFYDNVCVSTFGVATIYNVVNNGFSLVCPMEVTNNTFTENAGASGYAIAVGRSSDSRYINNIFYNNGSATPVLWSNSGVLTDVFQNCISDDPAFGLNQDPLFRDAANDDFRIDCSGLSPAIDGGTSSNVSISDFDFAALPRVANTVDIGAHEFQAGISIDASATTLCPGESVTLTASNATGLSWSGMVSNGVSFTPSSTDTYTVSGTTINNCVESSSIQIEVVDINDYAVSTATPSFCTSGTATIDLSGSSTENTYTLIEDGTSNVLDGPITGTGSALTLSTGVLSTTTDVTVVANKLLTSNAAFDFDGTGDYVALTTDNRSVTSTITVSTRVKATVTGAAQWLAVKYNGSNGYILFINSAGKAQIDGRDGAGGYKSSGPSTTTLTDGQWHEVTGVVSASGWSIYVDGVLESSGSYTLGGTLGSGATLTCGAYAGQFGNFDVDQLMIWNTALNATQIQDIMTTCYTGQEANLVGLYKFEETSGTALLDESPSALAGIVYGLDPTTQSIEGALNGCSEFCEKVMSPTVTITVSDIVAPIPDIASLPAVNSPCSLSSLSATSATDNCAGTITGTNNAVFPITSNTTVTWSYDDGNGNVSTQTQSINITDVSAPVPDVASLANVTDQCSVTTLVSPTSTDNCAGSIVGTTNATLPINSNTTITWTYDDGNGNVSTQMQDVVINDITAPAANLGSLPDLTASCSITSLTAPMATDNCEGVITGTSAVSLPIMSSTTITWTYDDGNGNTSTQMQNVIINDITDPIPSIASLSPITAQCSVTSLTAPTANDNCSGAITGTHNATLPITANTTITWSYDDGNGNISTQTQAVTLNDITAPTADLASLPNLTDQCSIGSLSAPTATDNCVGSVTATHNATLPITANTTITWTYDDGNGNTSTQMQNVVINDVTAPVEDLASLSAINSQCQVTSLTAPTATDNCSGSIIGTHNATLPITSNTTITWTYVDGNGNTSTQTQSVVVNDNIAPTEDLASLPVVSSQCEVTSLTAPTATDNCSGSITGTHNASLPISASTTITWTYDDGNGNASTQTQSVTINDITAPLADVSSLSDLTAQCEITTLTAPLATDNCEGSITGTHNATLPISASTAITWTYDDGNGNTSTQIQNVIINDNTDPVEDANSLTDLTAACEITTLTAPTATDNCSGSITGTPDVTLPIAASTTITWSYDDGNGNISTQTQDVIINDNVAPVADASSLADISETCQVTTLTAPTATDNCLGSLIGTHNATLPITVNTVITWTYDDGNGNTSTQMQNILITDALAPVPDVASLADITEVCEITTLTAPTATDNCSGNLTATSNAVFPITANTTVTWTYTDGNGNTSTQDQIIVITAVDATTSELNNVITANNSGADSYQWIDCNDNNNAIPGATSQQFTPTINGSYAVQVTTGNCTETSACTPISTIGIDEMNGITFNIYPNPTRSVVTIETEAQIESVTLTNAHGQVVQSENSSQFSIEALSIGVYFIEVETKHGTWRQRIVKQ